ESEGESFVTLGYLSTLYRDYARGDFTGSHLPAADKAKLRKSLGWFGDLALAPPESKDAEARKAVLAPANRTLFLILGAVFIIGILGLIGVLLLVIFCVFLFKGSLTAGLQSGSRHGGVYAETFAWWMVLFLLLNYAFGMSGIVSDLTADAAAFVLSLSA